MHSSYESVSQVTMGTSPVGASSSFSGIDVSFWAPEYVDYIGTGCEMVHYEVPTAFLSDYRPIPEGVTQVFLSLCLCFIIRNVLMMIICADSQ